jgi:predicted molibdopterin-dependent oxidoreductase YjgC
MSNRTFDWMGQEIGFREGESFAAALDAAGVRTFGSDSAGNLTRYFCGIGACQSCLIRVDGVIREACITPARTGARIGPIGKADG